jgi:hypothetical protein
MKYGTQFANAALSISLYPMFVDSVGILSLLITGQMFPVIPLVL